MVTLVAVLLALGAGCPVTDIGTLGDGEGSVLQTAGCWTTEGCDSRFLTDTDAHTISSGWRRMGRSGSI